MLVLHHAVTPSAQHPSIPANTSGGGGGGGSPHELEGQLDAWRRRVEAMRQGRRAYAKVLHLNPSQPAAWQDAAFAYHHEAQVGKAVLPARPKADFLAACCVLMLLLSSSPEQLVCLLLACSCCVPTLQWRLLARGHLAWRA